MNGAPTVRPAAAADFAAIAAITNHYIRTTAIHFGHAEVTAADLAAGWREHLDLYPWLVAEQDGALLGYAKAGAFRTRAAYRWTTELGLYVAPDRHRHGVGRSLYRRLLALLAAQGFRSAIGGITLPNPPSVALHEALGFRPTGVVRAAGWKLGRWHDVGFWQLELQAGDAAPGTIRTPAEAWPPLAD